MWFIILVVVVVIGAILGYLLSKDGERGEGCLSGAFMSGCLAAGCMWRILLAGFAIFAVIWLCKFLFT